MFELPADNPWPVLWAHAQSQGLHVIGVDEAGRGPLAGPVVAGAAYLGTCETTWTAQFPGLACSKSISPPKREVLYCALSQHAPGWAVAECSHHEIDTMNILQASLLAMHRAVDAVVAKAQLPAERCLVVVDGNKLPKWHYRSVAVVKGDAKVPAVSAGSILAKVHRDRWCLQAAQQYPQYGLDQHMGYPTAAHLAALAQHGPSPIHRKSYKPVRDALQNN